MPKRLAPSLIYIVAIFLLAPVARDLWTVAKNIPLPWLWVLAGLSLLALCARPIRATTSKWRQHPRTLLYSAALIAGTYLSSQILAIPEERFHLWEYAFLAMLLTNDLKKRTRLSPLAVMGLALGCSILVGIGDELWQALLPKRVGDVRDVGINALGSAIGIVGYWRIETSRDQSERRDPSTTPPR